MHFLWPHEETDCVLRWSLPVFTPDDVLDPVALKADGVAPWAAQAVALEWVGMTDFRPYDVCPGSR